jgi:hypothetical protein
MTPAQITKTFNGTPFVFRADGWFNMTKAEQHFGKELKKFWENLDTADYLLALSDQIGPNQPVYEANRGRYGGTWAHPKLAVFFARWLDVKFAVWCDAMIDDILKGAAVVAVVEPEKSAVMALPQRLRLSGAQGCAWPCPARRRMNGTSPCRTGHPRTAPRARSSTQRTV